MNTYVNAYYVCAQVRTPRQLPAGLLESLPISQGPWSNLAIDFLTNLLNSNGFTALCVIVDQAWRLLHMKGVPTAMETAEALSNQAFWVYG